MRRGFLMMFAAVTLAAASAQAGTEFRNRLFIGGGYGASWPEAPSSFRTGFKDAEPVWTGHIGYGLTQDMALRLSYSNMKYDVEKGGGDLLLQPIILGLKMHLLHDTAVNPYLLLGAGVSSNRLRSGTGAEETWTDFAAQGGVGLEFFIGKNFSLAAEGRYDYIEPKRSGAAFQTVSGVGLANIYFGTEDRTGTPQAAPAAAATAAPQTNQTVIVKTDDAERRRLEDERARLQAERDAAVAASSATAANAVATSSAAVAQAQAQVEDLKKRVERHEVKPIVFDTNSDRLLAGSNATLDEVAQIANQYPNLKLRVEGHTDNVGNDQKNQELSQRRAEAVKTYLSNKGVDANRITAVGYGESQPLQSNDTAAGRDKNRRVEFKFEQ